MPSVYPQLCPVAEARHAVVARDAGAFIGHVFEAGLWAFDGGNELLVGALHKPCGYRKRWELDDAALHRDDVSFRTWRSRDGGESWAGAGQIFALPVVLAQLSGNRPDAAGTPAPGPDVALFACGVPLATVESAVLYHSADRGGSWCGPRVYTLPLVDRRTWGQSSALVGADGKTLFFLTCVGPENRRRPVLCFLDRWQTHLQVLSFLPSDPDCDLLWPSAVVLPDGALLAVCTRRCGAGPGHTLVHRSDDGGRTWQWLSRANDLGEPGHVAWLPDGRLLLTCGWPLPPFRIVARFSEDGGRTWGPGFVVRDGGGSADLGSVRSVVRADGRVVSVYQWNELAGNRVFHGGVRHLAATVWTPAPP